MNANMELLKAVEAFEAELARSSELLKSDRKEMIRIRRVISTHIARIAELIPEISSEGAINANLRGEFSKVRHAIALHQANWPVVSIDFENPEYLTSRHEMRDANRRFIRLVKATFAE